ncbi:MAG: class I SAM-dependent methyltransferase [Pyrinomonadaceae bacterium]|nr:class I SAM-dependent methyltransferase [Pyrinomonadaceae bacterium]
MSTHKTDKELAFLHDLFVATDWGERFAQLVDEHIKLPGKGRALYVGSGTGGHAIALQERATSALKFLCIEETEEYLELARAKATAVKDPAEFRQGKVDQLELADNQFDFVIGDGSMADISRIPGMISEMVRVAKPGAMVAISLATAGSFGEFFSLYWEVLYNCGLHGHESNVEELITELLTTSELEGLAEHEGLEEVASWSRIEEFDFDTGERFLNSPLISDFLMNRWLEFIPEESQECIRQAIPGVVNDDRHEAEFILSVRATLVTGRKGRSH